jgi:hypothetical protein
MIYATYRLFYGEDFIRESIESIYKHVDKVFIFWTDRAFKDVVGATCMGDYVLFRKPIDGAVNIVNRMKKTHPKIEMIYDYWPHIDDQFRHQVDTHILPNFPRPDIVIALESDCVFSNKAISENIEQFKKETESNDNLVIGSVNQVLLWRYPTYHIEEARRGGVTFWCFNNFDKMPETGKAMAPPGFVKSPYDSVVLPEPNHNFGYAISEENMYWNHLVHIGFSSVNRTDTPPREDWYENVWLLWEDTESHINLHPSQGYAHVWPSAVKYDITLLPETIKRKYGYNL